MDGGASCRQVETCGYTNQVRLRGLLKIKDSLEPAEAGFVCIAPDFQSVGDWHSPRRHDFLSVGGMTDCIRH
jgi:hypothetical protein